MTAGVRITLPMLDGHSARRRLIRQNRRDESAVLEGLLEAVQGGRSGALVVRGQPGIGKTALLEHAVASAIGSGSFVRQGSSRERAGVRRAASAVRADARPP